MIKPISQVWKVAGSLLLVIVMTVSSLKSVTIVSGDSYDCLFELHEYEPIARLYDVKTGRTIERTPFDAFDLDWQNAYYTGQEWLYSNSEDKVTFIYNFLTEFDPMVYNPDSVHLPVYLDDLSVDAKHFVEEDVQTFTVRTFPTGTHVETLKKGMNRIPHPSQQCCLREREWGRHLFIAGAESAS